MTSEMRMKLAREPYEEKIRKVGLLVKLIKSAPKLRRDGAERQGVKLQNAAERAE